VKELDLYTAMLEVLEKRGVAFADKFAPMFIASIGAHLFNLVNYEKGILYECDLLYDTRVNLMFVAPPG